MRIGRFAVLAAALATAAGAQDAVAPVIPLQTVTLLPDHGRRMTVSVVLDGKGPYRFVVDTGAERTAISNELAATLALRSAGTARLHSVTGMAPVDLFHIGTLDIDQHRATGLRAPAIAKRAATISWCAHAAAPGGWLSWTPGWTERRSR